MTEFELKLGATTYVCRGNHFSKEFQNWNISAKFHDLRLSMDIPIESKVSTDKVMLFVTSLHEALSRVQQEKKSELTFINQLT